VYLSFFGRGTVKTGQWAKRFMVVIFGIHTKIATKLINFSSNIASAIGQVRLLFLYKVQSQAKATVVLLQ
jgi:hypothetical protein